MAADPGGCRHGAPNGLPPDASDTFELHQRIVSAGEGPSGAGDTGGLGVASDTAPADVGGAAKAGLGEGKVSGEPPTTATPTVDGLPPLHTVGAGRGQGKAGLGVINASPTRGSCVTCIGHSNACLGFLSPTTPSGTGSDSGGDAASIFRLKQQLYNIKEQLRCVKVEASQRLDRERRAWQLERTALVVGGTVALWQHSHCSLPYRVARATHHKHDPDGVRTVLLLWGTTQHGQPALLDAFGWPGGRARLTPVSHAGHLPKCPPPHPRTHPPTHPPTLFPCGSCRRPTTVR
jgi:hypothetical protein